uniref:MARVEL domain-containing protein n=1 Tax=Gasterosteus aculeatus aculeatus TaxID=481459 RepID=A0AAQ4PV67_GASAC
MGSGQSRNFSVYGRSRENTQSGRGPKNCHVKEPVYVCIDNFIMFVFLGLIFISVALPRFLHLLVEEYFACTLLVLLVELFGLQARAPVSWTNFTVNNPITVACYACLLCMVCRWSRFSPLRLNYQNSSGEARDHRIAATVFSCLATVAYMGEVSLTKARPGEVAGYMATAPGLLKVCQTSVRASSSLWCMAVYCICFILSMAVVMLCVGECTGCLHVPFLFLSAYGLLAAVMYLKATILWPVFQFDRQYAGSGRASSKTIAAAVLTTLNFLLYLADLAYTARHRPIIQTVFCKS